MTGPPNKLRLDEGTDVLYWRRRVRLLQSFCLPSAVRRWPSTCAHRMGVTPSGPRSGWDENAETFPFAAEMQADTCFDMCQRPEPRVFSWAKHDLSRPVVNGLGGPGSMGAVGSSLGVPAGAMAGCSAQIGNSSLDPVLTSPSLCAVAHHPRSCQVLAKALVRGRGRWSWSRQDPSTILE